MDSVEGFGAPLSLEPSWTTEPKREKKKRPEKKEPEKKEKKKIRTDNLPWN